MGDARRIEALDVSHMQGSSPVVSCVVLLDGTAAPDEHLRWPVTSAGPSDDYAALREGIHQRSGQRTRLMALVQPVCTL